LDQQEVLSPDYNYRKKEKKIYKINEKKAKQKKKGKMKLIHLDDKLNPNP